MLATTREKGSPRARWAGLVPGAAPVESSVQPPQTPRTEPRRHPASPCLGVSSTLREPPAPQFPAALLTAAETRRLPECLLTGGGGERVAHSHTGAHSAVRGRRSCRSHQHSRTHRALAEWSESARKRLIFKKVF